MLELISVLLSSEEKAYSMTDLFQTMKDIKGHMGGVHRQEKK